MQNLKVYLKPGKEKAIKNFHHWIFSGAIEKMPSCKAGELISIYSSKNELLGTAYFNPKTSIAGRMIAFGNENPKEAVYHSIINAIKLRKSLISANTSGFRVINAEGDQLPGLIVDFYNGWLVIQISTAGMESLKKEIIEILKKELSPLGIYEKSLSSSRKEESLPLVEENLFNKIPEEILIEENSLKFFVNPIKGQKTGFFLDQREMRSWVKNFAQHKKILNCFSYTGGFSVYALAGGAASVTSVDISKEAMELCQKNCEINQVVGEYIVEDVFTFLREKPLKYDLIILDPPAFAKKAKDVNQACRGYKDINRLALQKMPAQSILLTCSCSYFIDEALFQKVIFQASVEANRKVKIIGKHKQAVDHPINIFHPEGQYLKSLILYVE